MWSKNSDKKTTKGKQSATRERERHFFDCGEIFVYGTVTIEKKLKKQKDKTKKQSVAVWTIKSKKKAYEQVCACLCMYRSSTAL